MLKCPKSCQEGLQCLCLAIDDEWLDVIYTLTRSQPPGWTGYGRRIDAELLRGVAWPVEQHPLACICGPTPFVETAAAAPLPLGYEPKRIRMEHFGPIGGS